MARVIWRSKTIHWTEVRELIICLITELICCFVVYIMGERVNFVCINCLKETIVKWKGLI